MTNTTKNTLVGEEWKEVIFDFEYINKLKIEVSNYGRVRSFSKITQGKILQGYLINGYRIISFKFFKARNAEMTTIIEDYQSQISALKRDTGAVRTKLQTKRVKDKIYYDYLKYIDNGKKKLEKLQGIYKKIYKKDELKRTINHGVLVHRMVAEYFSAKPTPQHTIVGHLNFDKLDNLSTNLKWMTKEENFVHQSGSPYVIKARTNRTHLQNQKSSAFKLTSASVMLIKKKIDQGIALRIIAKSFKVSETQLLRIKRGENWGNIKAAQ